MPPLAGRRPGARRIAAALFELGGDALAFGARVVTGRGPRTAAEIEPPRDAEDRADGPHGETETAAAAARRAAAAEEAAARLDAARERLRATIAAPRDDDEPDRAPGEGAPGPAPGDDPSEPARADGARRPAGDGGSSAPPPA